MAKRWHMVYLWSVWHVQAAAFNLDTQNVLKKSGDPGSLFGFSVAFHQQLNPTRRNLLLVGAPRAKHPNEVNVTGVTYQCELTTTSERCQPIEFDHEDFLDSKGIDNQWMGVRVMSQGPGKNVMSCAHRYQQWSPSPDAKTSHLVTGQCYLLGDDLQVRKEDRSLRRVVCDNEHLTTRFRFNLKTPDGFAYCQQGHGASFAKDGKSLLFGAPGAYQWKGLVRMEILNKNDNLVVYSRESGDIDQFEAELIPLQGNSYLGFSIDSGLALISKGELTIVSGAPRGGYSGQVAFLRADPDAKRNLSVELVLSGPGLASSFGYDVAVVDFNGDGWDDLAVGAPEFFRKDDVVGGAVYIYINNKGENWESITSINLFGPKDSMFGLAVEYIGDVNQDGNGDIAVGAPYDGSGQVYLYYGSPNGINTKPAQILSSGSKSVTLFGYSLSGNLDVDDNQYPDLAVGSLSDSVFVYKARPVVSVHTSLKITPSEIDLAKEQCDKRKCAFGVKACFTYTAHSASFKPNLTLSYTFEADKRGARLPPRVVFLDSSKGRLELPRQNREKCANTRLQLLRDIRDRLQGIPVSVTVSLGPQTSRRGAGPSDLTPVLNPFQGDDNRSQITFVSSGCSSDRRCRSNLASSYKFCSRKRENEQDVFKSLAREDGVAVITPTEENIALEITVTNRNGDEAHQSRSNISLPDTLRYSSVVTTASKTSVRCTANNKGTIIDCELGNPLQRDAEVTFYVLLTTSGISLSTKSVSIMVQLETTSEQTIQPVEAFAKVVFELELQVNGLARPSQVSLVPNLKGDSAIKSLEEIGAAVQYEFKITNLGRPLKSFANASLNVLWPEQNSGGKWLLNLTNVTSEGVQFVPCSVNQLKIIKGRHGVSRKRREAKLEPYSTDIFSFLATKRKYKTLTCSDGLQCVEIHCPLLGVDSSAVMVLQSRLWNSTLSQDYSSLNYLDIVVDATLSLTNSPENIGLKQEKLDTKVKLTVFLEKETRLNKVAWWIIFLTVIALLLLLAVLIFSLWKRGCIHRPARNVKPH